jgi:hypothetical protein
VKKRQLLGISANDVAQRHSAAKQDKPQALYLKSFSDFQQWALALLRRSAEGLKSIVRLSPIPDLSENIEYNGIKRIR